MKPKKQEQYITCRQFIRELLPRIKKATDVLCPEKATKDNGLLIAYIRTFKPEILICVDQVMDPQRALQFLESLTSAFRACKMRVTSVRSTRLNCHGKPVDNRRFNKAVLRFERL